MSTAGRAAGQDTALMSLAETAGYLGLTEAQVLELVRQKELYPVRPGLLFNLEILADWKSRNLTHIVTPIPPEQ